MAQVEGKIDHVKPPFTAEHICPVNENVVTVHDADDQLQGELIVPRRNWSMSRKNTLPPDCLDILGRDGGSARFSAFLVQQFDREQTGMPFIHVKAGNVRI